MVVRIWADCEYTTKTERQKKTPKLAIGRKKKDMKNYYENYYEKNNRMKALNKKRRIDCSVYIIFNNVM